MRICYLILAHNNFQHLDRLISTLDDGNATFCIHLDKKVAFDYQTQNENAVIIPTQIDVKWAGFSMIEATLALINYAKENYPSDYYILISGADYPIRKPSFLYDLLKEGKEYIDVHLAPVQGKPTTLHEYYYFDYDRRARPRLPKARFYRTIEKLCFFLKIKRKMPFDIYVGSQWFALTDACIAYIIDTVKTKPIYINFFKHVNIPDESFIQTIIAHSHFMNNVDTTLVYADWSGPVAPAIIGEEHIELLESEMVFEYIYGKHKPCFARKFTDKSTEVLDEIDKRLRQ